MADLNLFKFGCAIINLVAEIRNTLYHGFHIRWLLFSIFCTYVVFRHLDLLKAFGYIKRVVKISEKTYFASYVRNRL